MYSKVNISYLIFLSVISLYSLLFAGAPDTLWTKTYKDGAHNEGFSVQQTSDGGFIIVGYSMTDDSIQEQIYIIRTDVQGGTIWTKIYGGTGVDRGNSVQQTTDGGFIIAGTKSSMVYIIRTNSSGDTLWTKTYGGAGSDVGYSLQRISDRGFIIAGSTMSYSSGDPDVYIIRTDSIGDSVWTRTYGGADNDMSYSIQNTRDSGFIIAGYTESFGVQYQDIYLIRIDYNGDTLWSKTYGGTSIDESYSVQQTNDGGFIIAGYTNSFGLGKSDFYLIRTNAVGDTLWTKTYGGTERDGGGSVQQMSDSGFIIAGYTEPFGVGSYDVFIIRTKSNGDTIWTKTIGGDSSNEIGNSIQQTSDGGFIIVGITDSSVTGSSEVYLIRLDKETVGIQEDNSFNFLNPNDFIITYNNNNLISIRYILQNSSSVKLVAYDIKGKLVKVITDKFMNKGSYSISLDNKRFGSGVFFIKLSVNGCAVSKRVVLVK